MCCWGGQLAHATEYTEDYVIQSFGEASICTVSDDIVQVVKVDTNDFKVLQEVVNAGKTLIGSKINTYTGSDLGNKNTFSELAEEIDNVYDKGYTDGLSKSATKEGTIVYTYHKHSAACYGTCGRGLRDASYYSVNGPEGYGLNYWVYYYVCDLCGYRKSFGNAAEKWHWDQSNPNPTCPQSVLKCNKTTSTIESATITFE